MTPDPRPTKRPGEEHRGLTNGNGIPRPAGLTNGLGRTNGTGRTNGLTNGLKGRTNGLTNGLAARTNGLTNGLVNGTGRTNGMTNGVRGRSNGLTNGLTNGTGRTNGTGVINGLMSGTIRRGLRHNRFGVISQKDLRLGVTIVALFLLLLGPFYLLMSTPAPAPPTRIAVDGNLGDWNGIAFLDDAVGSPNANIALRRYSVWEENGYTSFAIQVTGIALGDSTGLDGFYVFIDKDGSAVTGYHAREIGADYMIAVRGGNNAVSTANLYLFKTGTDPYDWSGWQPIDTVRAAVSANGGVEIQLLPGAVDWIVGSRQFLVAASDYEGNETFGRVHFDTGLRALLIEQIVTSDVVTATNSPFANLRFTAFGGPVDVVRVPLTKSHGTAVLTDLTSFTVPVTGPVTRPESVSYTPADVGDYIAAHVDPTTVQRTGGVPLAVEGPELVTYLGSAPSEHRVEGYFQDWAPSGLAPDTAVVQDANVDVANYGAAHTVVVSPAASTVFVYADVAGRIFGGSGVVERFERPMGGGGGSGSTGPIVSRMGQDIFRAYIDVNVGSPQGAPILGVRADYYIEITGLYGHVLSKRAFEWSGSTWIASSRTVLVANDRTRMEASLDLTGVTTGTMAMAIEATDWRLLSDDTGVYNFLGTHGGGTRDGPGLAPLHGTGAATAIAKPLSGAPTVDGDCSDSVYSGAGTFSTADLNGVVGTSALYVYICIDVTSDTTSEGTDNANIYFDTQHNGGATPQTDDRKFGVFSNTSVLIASKGNGLIWVPCAPICGGAEAAAGAFTGGHEVYEFKIRFNDTWGTDTPSGNQEAGFAVIAKDVTGGATYTWGSTDPPTDLVPNSWGHIDAPEFSEILVPVAVVGVIYLVARRRRRDEDS